jgi:parallel beta-helix repeat protein
MKPTRMLGLAGLVAGAAVAVAVAAPWPEAAIPPVEVSYGAPGQVLKGEISLRATATAKEARVVAVTFLLDGRAIGSDTTPPYTLDVSTRLLPPGEHRLRVAAVDTLGRRAATKPARVRIRAGGNPIVTASPSRGLQQALSALRRGQVTVLLAPGRYVLSEVTLGSGARLVGSGAATVIVPPTGGGYFALLVARGSGIRISDLSLDGGGPGAGKGIGVAVFKGSSDVRLQRLRLTRVRGDAVNAWGQHADISVQDSIIDGGGYGYAGVRILGSDQSRDASVIRTRIRGFRGYGIVFPQKEYGRPAAALHALALDNTISDIYDPAHAVCKTNPLTPFCGTTEAAIESGGVAAAIVGNTIRRTGWDGIETVGSSTRVSVIDNDIGETGTGIYLEHSTNLSLISNNRIAGVKKGINVEWRYGGIDSDENTISFNRILSATRSGLFVDVGADDNRIVGNVFVGGARPAIILQGSSRNIVRSNLGCRGDGGPLVREQTGWHDDGGEAPPLDNRLIGNTDVHPCDAG